MSTTGSSPQPALPDPNPAVDFSGLKLRVQTSLEPFPQADREAVVGVSSFGFGGTNAHVVLGERPDPAPAAAAQPQALKPLPLQLLSLSAHSDAALRQKASDLAGLLREQPELSLIDLCATANQRRSQLSRRLVCLAPNHAVFQQQLDGFAAGGEPQGIIWGQASRRPGKLAFLFTGQGSQTLGMAEGLLRHHPVFRAAFEACTRLVDPLLPQPLAGVIYPAAGMEEAAASCPEPDPIHPTGPVCGGLRPRPALAELGNSSRPADGSQRR